MTRAEFHRHLPPSLFGFGPSGKAKGTLGRFGAWLRSLPPPRPVTTLAQMSREKQAEMRKLYNRPGIA